MLFSQTLNSLLLKIVYVPTGLPEISETTPTLLNGARWNG
jgi:hypothetical protein